MSRGSVHEPMAEVVKSWLITLIGLLVPKRAGKVVVYSQPDFEDGAIAVLDELVARGRDPIVLCNRLPDARRFAAQFGRRPRMAGKDSIRGRFHYLTAGTVIATHSVLRGHRAPPTQTVVNIWHGEPLTKKVGLWDGMIPPPSTWSTALSEIGKAFRCAEFGLTPEQVMVSGAPRNDRLLAADPAAVRRAAMPGSGGEHLFLWLPTYRAATTTGRVDGERFDGPLPLHAADARALDVWLGERDAWMLVKAHPLQQLPAPGEFRRIVVIDSDWMTARGQTLYTLLAGVDCLISDASTVWIDFLLADRPLICAFPDIDVYRRNRGLHLEPYEQWVPGPFVKSGPELIAALDAVAAGEDSHGDQRRRMLARLHRHRDTASTKRVLDGAGL